MQRPCVALPLIFDLTQALRTNIDDLDKSIPDKNIH